MVSLFSHSICRARHSVYHLMLQFIEQAASQMRTCSSFKITDAHHCLGCWTGVETWDVVWFKLSPHWTQYCSVLVHVSKGTEATVPRRVAINWYLEKALLMSVLFYKLCNYIQYILKVSVIYRCLQLKKKKWFCGIPHFSRKNIEHKIVHTHTHNINRCD